MLIHQSHAGAVIGRGGAKIKELREQTNSHLKVFQECCPNSSDRLLMITCDQQERMPEIVKDIIAYLKEVVFVLKLNCLRIYCCDNIIMKFALLLQVPIKGSQRQYDSANYDPHLNYGGYADKSSNFTGGGGRGSGGGGRSGGGGGRRDSDRMFSQYDSYRGPPPPQYGR